MTTVPKLETLPGVIGSRRVPTEYDVATITRAGITIITLSDDRWRRFSGLSLASAFRRAEAAQNPADAIHREPYPDPRTVPAPPARMSAICHLLNWVARRR